jgi:LEA14-like dessication related protein
VLRALFVALSLFIAGCATPGADQLEVGLASVALVDVSLLEQRLALTLRFQNRSDRDFTIDGLAFTLDINGRSFAKGVSPQRFDLPRYSEARVDVEAVSGLGDVLHQIIGLQQLVANGDQLDRGAVPRLGYRLHGHASIAGRPFGLSFDTTSELPLPRELVLPAR